MKITINFVNGVSEVVTDSPVSTPELVGHLMAAVNGVLCMNTIASNNMAGLPMDVVARVRREIDAIMNKVRKDYPRGGGKEGGPAVGS